MSMPKIYMKDNLVLAAIMTIAVAIIFTGTPSAIGGNEHNMMTVSGKGSILLAADKPTLTITISEQGDGTVDIREAVNKRYAFLQTHLKEVNIDIDNLQTQRAVQSSIYNSGVIRQADGLEVPRPSMYRYELGLKLVGLESVETAVEIMDWCLDNSISSYININFETEDQSAAYQRALQLAQEDAYEKIKALSSNGKYELVSITEASYSPYTRSYDGIAINSMESFAGAPDIRAQDVEVTAQVQLTVQLK